MIVVVGSRHDAVAKDLVASWPGSALCAAEDFVSSGWIWPLGQSSRTWIVNSRAVRDEDVTGVFTRRSTFYPEELLTIHPADRAFLASEIHSFLTFILATTSARVVNPVREGVFGEESLRPERWSQIASQLGISVRPLRVTSKPRRRISCRTHYVEVVGAEVFGDVPTRVLEAAHNLAGALEVVWGVFVFDARHRLVTITTARRPSNKAAAALEQLLKAAR